MALMERLVCDWSWLWRFSWAVAIALFLAVGVFGAPPITIAYVYFGELAFVGALRARSIRRHPNQ
jgi:hypothetical protein